MLSNVDVCVWNKPEQLEIRFVACVFSFKRWLLADQVSE